MKRLINKGLILLIIIGILASIPLIGERLKWEKTSNQVEVVMDYDDIFLLTNNTHNVENEQKQFFDSVKGNVHSFAIYESTLERLKIQGEYSGDTWVYSGKELLDPLRNINLDREIDPKHTYVLFSNQQLADTWIPLMKQFLGEEGAIQEFAFESYIGLDIEAPYRSIKSLPLGIDPLLVKQIKENGFEIVPRLSNSYKDKTRAVALVQQAAAYKPSAFIFQGDEVTGFPSHLVDVAEIMNKNNINLGMIEMLKSDQLGMNKLSYQLAHFNEQDKANNDWTMARVHSLSERTLQKKMAITPEQLKGKAPAEFLDLQEQVELAVTERNIRMIYVHAAMPVGSHVPLEQFDYLTLNDEPENMLKATELGIQDFSNRIEQEGFTLGKAAPFHYQENSWMAVARWLALLGGIAVIALMVNSFIPSMQVIVFALGIIGIVLAKLLHLDSLYFKFIGLGTAVSIPVLAIRYSLNQLAVKTKSSFAHMLKIYFVTSLISFVGAWLVVGMYSHVKYSLYMDQFRGVSVLYAAPLLLALILVMRFLNEPFVKWLKGNFKNYYVLLAGALGVLALYYLSRSGNEASISSLEIKFRSLLQSGLDVRPRTKEFLIGYPLFFLGIYLFSTYKRAAYLLVAATMAQLSIVSTFTHLHTPFIISVIRTGIGLVLGLVIGLLFVLGWKIIIPIVEKIARRVNL